MKYLVIGLVLIFIALYLVMLYSLLIMSARSDEVMRQLMEKEWMEKNPNKILWCGEFGTIRHAKLEWRIAWFKDVITFFKEHNIPYSVWNYLSTPNDGNRFSLVDDDNRKILSPEFLHVLLGEF